MAGPSSWWRRIGAAFAALTLAVLTFGPSLDGILCHDETGVSGVAVAAAGVETAHGGDHADEAAPCVHGHCHHGASLLAATPMQTATVKLVSDRHPWARSRVATSDPKFGLIRPPRA